MANLRTHGEVHQQAALEWVVFESLVVVILVGLAIGYGFALWRARARGRWPIARTSMWYLGLACAGAGLVGPIATAAHTSFTVHMIGHLLLGMLAPLLMVLAAPITLALRALPVAAARRLTRVLRTPWVRFVTHPVVAAVLNAGGLWLLYTTELFHLMHASVAVHALVHTHIFLAGYVFTASIVGVDPDPHRASILMRSAVLIAFITTGRFTSGALEYVNTSPDRIILVDGQQLVSLMIQYRVGVEVKQTYSVVEIDADYFT